MDGIEIGSPVGVRYIPYGANDNGDDYDSDKKDDDYDDDGDGDDDDDGDYRDFSMLWRAVAVSWHSGASTECARA